MKSLSNHNLPHSSTDIAVFTYDRKRVTCGIVHFGVGNFHRCHQAIYCDDLLCQGETQWGITGVSMRSAGIRDALKPQDYLYTQATLGSELNYRVVAAIKDILVAPEDPVAVINAAAASTTVLITTTITEKGYCLKSGNLDTANPDFNKDQLSLNAPQTIYGYLAAAIIRRFQSHQTPLTILCCDNIQGGGEHLKSGVTQLLMQHCPAATEWIRQCVAFSSSMVDRVSPATNDSLKQRVADKLHCKDQWPVAAEPFSQWIIEDSFAGPRPPFDRAGAIFVDAIEPFKQMKLRLLNASHSIVSALGFLAGNQAIHQALQRPLVLEFTRRALRQALLPVTRIPSGSDGEQYIQQVLSRFHNSALPYAVLQVGKDSSQKIQQRWFPCIDQALAGKHDDSYFSFTLAAWLCFIIEASNQGVLDDPQAEAFKPCLEQDAGALIASLLKLAGADNFKFFHHPGFMAAVEKYWQAISQHGIERALNDFLNSDL